MVAIIVRASPDWPSFDLERSRSFLRAAGLPETIVIELAELWDRTFSVDYRSFRQALKLLSRSTNAAVIGATTGDLAHISDVPLGERDRIVFVDDDDWLAPDLVSSLPPNGAEALVSWGSVRLGPDFGTHAELAPGPIQLRLLDSVIYTNNYSLSPRLVEREGIAPFREHYDVARALGPTDIRVQVPSYLSCAVKHHCSTMSAYRLLGREAFRRDPRRHLELFRDDLATAVIPQAAEWMRPYVGSFLAIMRDALA